MKNITIYYSPDADDAFMMYGLANGAVALQDLKITLKREDIETLNQRTKKEKLDISAVSVHAYSYIADNYKILSTAASFAGKDYGPRLLTKRTVDLKAAKQLRIAVPGEMTSASLALKIFMSKNKLNHELVNLEFSQITKAVFEEKVDGGVVIHEGQLTHDKYNLQIALDLGNWWWNEFKLSLPLGVMVVNKNFSDVEQLQIRNIIYQSIKYAMDNRTKALEFAQQFRRELCLDTLDQYVNMYVNQQTLEMTEQGKEAIKVFLEEGKNLNLIKNKFIVEYI